MRSSECSKAASLNADVRQNMKLPLLLLLFLAGCTTPTGFPKPFTFVGIPEKINEKSWTTVDGKVQSMTIRVVKVTKGKYEEKKIGFDFPIGSKAPLIIGQTYLFEAVYDRHGIRYTDWKKN